MNIKLIPKYARSCWSGIVFNARKYSPELCTAGSIISGVGCVVTACIATTKLKGIVDEYKEAADKIHSRAMFNKDHQEGKDLTKLYFRTGFKIARLYSVPAALGATSITLSLSSHNIMKKRNTILATMAAASESKLNDYRKRVVERFGEEVDQELAGNYVDKVVEKEVVDPETGEKKYINETTREWKGYSEWTRFWGPGCSGWEEPASVGPLGNAHYIYAQEKALNDILIYTRRLYLNEIYHQLGFPEIDEGWDYGIIFDPSGPEKQFDFGLRRKFNTQGAKFLNGEEQGAYLDPCNITYIKDKFLPKNVEVAKFYTQMRKEEERNDKKRGLFR